MFEGERGRVLQANLKEFLDRPENRPLVEKQQRKEVKQAIALKSRQHELEFRRKLLSSDSEVQQNVGPYLESAVLRRIVMCLANDPDGDFGKWAKNPRVLSMLREAKSLVDEKRLTEEEIEHVFLRQLKDPRNPDHQVFVEKTKQVVKLQADQLVEALNEQLGERYKGNDAYRRKEFNKAMEHYSRALAVVTFVQAANPEDQKEIDSNKTDVLLNMAAVHIEKQEFGAAVSRCTEALCLDGDNIKALMRRARAFSLRHDYGNANKDLRKVLDLDPWNFEAHDELERVARLEVKGASSDKMTFKRMFHG